MKRMMLVSLVFILGIACSIQAEHLDQQIPDCPILSDSKLIEEHAGKVILIDFWATWCGPCHKAIPYLNTLHDELKEQGFVVIAINVDEDVSAVPAFLKRYPVDYPMLFDSSGACPSVFNVEVMPSSYLIDKSGTIQYIHKGFRNNDRESLRDRIQHHLNT